MNLLIITFIFFFFFFESELKQLAILAKETIIRTKRMKITTRTVTTTLRTVKMVVMVRVKDRGTRRKFNLFRQSS